MTRNILGTIAVAASVLASGAASAMDVPIPVVVSEPGVVGLVAGAAVAAILLARYRKRK